MHLQGRPGSLEDLLAAMSTPGVHDIDLTGVTLELGRQLVNEGPTASLVLRAWPAGCTVTGGAITIPDSAIVLLTGGGATFKGTTFMGAMRCLSLDAVPQWRGLDAVPRSRCSASVEGPSAPNTRWRGVSV